MPQNLLKDIHDHALEDYPFECCGIIIGKDDSDTEDILYRCKNIQNELHEKDPKKFQRDARTAFYVDPKEQMKVFKEASRLGMIVKVFYHSHPEHNAYFSTEDRQMATFEGEPIYPKALYLVVSVYNGKIKEEAFFSWDPGSRSFLERKRNI